MIAQIASDFKRLDVSVPPHGVDAPDRPTARGPIHLMLELRDDALIVLYDGDCGFCKVMLALVLTWDRAHRLVAVPIQSTPGQQLLSDMSPERRLESWHVVDQGRAIHSDGSATPVLFAALPRGAVLARVASRFPRTTSRVYWWVASHRVLLGRLFAARSRAWATRVIARRTIVGP